MRSGRRTTPSPVKIQSPQFRTPSEAVQGRSKANRKTLMAAMRMAATPIAHGRPKSAAYCSRKASILTDPCPRRGLPALPKARVVGGQIGERGVGHGGHDRLDRPEPGIARTARIRLELHHLQLQVTRRLTGDAGNSLGLVSLAIRTV